MAIACRSHATVASVPMLFRTSVHPIATLVVSCLSLTACGSIYASLLSIPSDRLVSSALLFYCNHQTRTQNWRGLEHLLKAFAERFEQRDARRLGTGLGIGGSLSAANRKSALLLPNWFDDATEYRLKKALVRWAAPCVMCSWDT